MAGLSLAGSPGSGIGPSKTDSYHIQTKTLQKSCRVCEIPAQFIDSKFYLITGRED